MGGIKNTKGLKYKLGFQQGTILYFRGGLLTAVHKCCALITAAVS